MKFWSQSDNNAGSAAAYRLVSDTERLSDEKDHHASRRASSKSSPRNILAILGGLLALFTLSVLLRSGSSSSRAEREHSVEVVPNTVHFVILGDKPQFKVNIVNWLAVWSAHHWMQPEAICKFKERDDLPGPPLIRPRRSQSFTPTTTRRSSKQPSPALRQTHTRVPSSAFRPFTSIT